MKIAIIGANGQLGSDLCLILSRADLLPLSHSDIEVTSIDSVSHTLEKYRPDVVINTAAFFPMEKCELDPDRSFQVNTLGARNVAVVSARIGAKVVYISSDYVFGGDVKHGNIPYTEFDMTMPINIYGRSKLAGEKFVQHLCPRHFIVRSSGFFGISGSRSRGGNFVESIIRLTRERNELRVVHDQIFSPTYTNDLAKKISELISTEYYGTFHITNSGACSWFEFAREILTQAGIVKPINPITSEEYSQKGKRPKFSVLSNYHLRLLGMDDMRPWQEALKDYMISKRHIQR